MKSASSRVPKTPRRPRLAVTLGDPAGVGPEIVLKALLRPDLVRLADYTVHGDHNLLRDTAARLGLRYDWDRLGPNGAAVRVVEDPASARRSAKIRPGRWTVSGGVASLAWVRAAALACLPSVDDPHDALVTAPICKAAWKAAGAVWPGHTELLAFLCRQATGRDAREVMLLAGGGLRVALATVHTPLARVPAELTIDRLVSVGRALHRGLATDFGLPRPRIAVLGLNPHAGEDGHLGAEEQTVILPALRRLRRAGIDAHGPVPADTAFHFARQGRYDAILAMYHDQGLGPLKTVAFHDGVNITLGLPLVRTSVDHGTAFDIAGRGVADESSLVAAIRQSVEIVAHRKRARAPGCSAARKGGS